MKRIVFLLWGLLLTLIVLAGVLLWLLETTSGAKASINLLNTFTPIKVQYSDLKGNLYALELNDAKIESATFNAKINHLNLEWSPFTALFQQGVQIEKFTSRNVELTLADTESDTKAIENIDWRLPVKLGIKSAIINNLYIPSFHPDAIKQLSVAAQLEKDEWIISEFSFEHPDLTAEFTGQLIPFDQLTHSLDFKFNTNQFGSGVLNSQGNIEQSIITLNLVEQKTNLNASLTNWLTNPKLDFSADIDSPDLLGNPAKLKIKGIGTFNEGNVSLGGKIADQNIKIDKLDYIRKNKEFSVLSEGVFLEALFVLKADFSKDKLHKSELSWAPKTPLANVKINSSKTRISGAWNNLEISNESLANTHGQKAKLAISANLKDFQNLKINPSKLAILGGEITLAGDASLQAPLSLNLNSNAKNIQLEKVDPRLPKLQSGVAQINWVNGEKQSALTASLSNLQAIINSSPVTGYGELKISNDVIQLATLNLEAKGNNSIKLELLDPVTQFISIDSNINDLGAFINDASGLIKGKVDVGIKSTLVNGQIEASNLKVTDLLSIEALSLVASHPGNTQLINISGTELKLNDYLINKADLDINGTQEQHQIELGLTDSKDRTLSLNAQGNLSNAEYQLDVQKLSSSSQELGSIKNNGPIEFIYSMQKAVLKPFCLDSEIILFCGDLQTGETIDGQVDLTILASDTNRNTNTQLGTVTLIPKTDTKIQANFQIANKQFSKLIVDASLGKLAIRNQDEETLDLDNLILTATGENNNIAVIFNSDVAGGTIGLQGTLNGDYNDPNIEASLKGHLPKLEDVSPLLISTDIRQGNFLFELLINGRLKTPTVSGFAKVNDTKVHIPELGTTQNIALDLEMRDAANGTINGLINSGDGKGLLDGTIKWEKEPVAELKLTGNKLLIADTKSLSLTASPDLVMNYSPGKLDLNGEIKIDRAFTTLASSGSNTSLSNDIVFVDEELGLEPETVSSIQKRNINITTEFINPARIESFGLIGAVTGKLRITQKDSGPVLGNGQLSITGQYKAFGQVLQIESGRLNYVNTALDNPVIEFYATRQIADIKVGVRVSGRPNALISKLESTPSMREAEILNYLVLGKAPGAASEAESNQLTQAAVALALARSESGIQNIAGKAGLSDLSLTQELGGLALSLGKQLSPRLYLGYTMGFIEPINIAKVRYILSSKWVLESEISDETRAILKYRFEKD